jgi:hypothetical protein
MGQFKPMVKMMTTEPSVILKLKKGGAVAMKSGGSTTKAKKMAMGGLRSASPAMPSPMTAMGTPPAMPAGVSPKKPSMASRRKAMMASKMPVRPVMKDGGSALEKHADMPASKAHKGLKTGGVAMGQGGYKDGGNVIPVSASKKGAEGYVNTKMNTATPDHSPAKTGGVKMGNAGGYKKGGTAKYAKGGGVEGNVSTTPAGVTNTTTGGVKKGNGGGYKKGGALKKFADGGSVQDDGRPVKMPQGSKRPPSSVSISQLSGTYRKGGKVKKYAGGGAMSDKEQSEAYDKFYADEKAENEAERAAVMRAIKSPFQTMKELPDRLKQGYEAIKKGMKGSGSVTTTEREVSRTVSPGKKRGGKC